MSLKLTVYIDFIDYKNKYLWYWSSDSLFFNDLYSDSLPKLQSQIKTVSEDNLNRQNFTTSSSNCFFNCNFYQSIKIIVWQSEKRNKFIFCNK